MGYSQIKKKEKLLIIDTKDIINVEEKIIKKKRINIFIYYYGFILWWNFLQQKRKHITMQTHKYCLHTIKSNCCWCLWSTPTSSYISLREQNDQMKHAKEKKTILWNCLKRIVWCIMCFMQQKDRCHVFMTGNKVKE